MPAADLKETLSQLTTEAVPEIPRLDQASLPSRIPGSRGRPGQPRTIDEATLSSLIDNYESLTLDPIHDALLDGVQLLFDRLAGQACPHLEQNQRLVEKVTELSKKYGFLLFVVHDGAVVRGGVAAKAKPNSAVSNQAAPSILAGVFGVSVYGDDGNRVGGTSLAAFPQMIIGRDLEDAKERWAQRAKTK